MRGKFITVEGQDGAGKSTNLSVMKRLLSDRNISFVETREPGGTSLGETIRSLILDSSDEKFGDQAELLLMFAARAQHIEQVIEPALANGSWVLCDRFTDASYAYQGGGRQLGFEMIAELEQLVQGDLRPDLTVLLDLPIELGEKRSELRSQEQDASISAIDRFEAQKLDFKQRVRDSYLQIAKDHPQRVKVIDASASLAAVETDIIATLSSFIDCVASEKEHDDV
jgi:dTMP kinase